MDRALAALSVLAPQDVQIGKLKLPGVTFYALPHTGEGVEDFDGLLTTELFGRVFIDHAGRYTILDPQ